MSYLSLHRNILKAINISQCPQIIFDATVVNTFFDTENIRSRALLGDFTTSIGKILSETNWKRFLLEGGGGVIDNFVKILIVLQYCR